MSIARRKIIGLFAASAATALAGCGGGGDYTPPTRFVWLLNLNPEFPSADVSLGATTIASGLPFPGLTSRTEVEYGSYTIGLRERSTGVTQNFDGVPVDGFSPSMFVFYRRFASTRLGSSPPGIINYVDSNVSLDVDLFDDVGNVQLERLAFEGSAPQNSRESQLHSAPLRGRKLRADLRLRAAATHRFDPGVPAYSSRIAAVRPGRRDRAELRAERCGCRELAEPARWNKP